LCVCSYVYSCVCVNIGVCVYTCKLTGHFDMKRVNWECKYMCVCKHVDVHAVRIHICVCVNVHV